MISGTGEKVLWTKTRRRTTICSAARRPKKTVSEWMRQAVTDVYRRQLGLPVEWTPEQQELFLDLVTARLDEKAFDLAMDLRSAAIQRWTAEHGQHPDYLTTVKLHQTAEENAREAIVRQELYDKITDDETKHQPPAQVTGVPWRERWMHLRYRTEPNEAIEELVRQVWPEDRYTAMFRVTASYLLAARLEDGLELPTSRRHILAVELVPQVNKELDNLGYPPE